MARQENGFTIIEILIVTIIIAILAAISITIYQDLSIRSRVSEGIALASKAKNAVSESALSKNALPTNQFETGYESPPPTENVSNISIGNNGLIVITFSVVAGDGTIIFQPTIVNNSHVSWDCKGGTLQGRYRPAICR